MTVRGTHLKRLPADDLNRACWHCGEVKQMREFKAAKGCKGGRSRKCKECVRAYEIKMRQRLKRVELV